MGVSGADQCAAYISMIRFQICHYTFPGKFSAAGPADLEKKNTWSG